MSRRYFRLSALAAVAVLGFTVTPAAIAASTTEDKPILPPSVYGAHDPFYDTPHHIPSTPGVLIRAERMKSVGTMTVGKQQFPLKYTRIMYSSRDMHNRPIAVTGYYVESISKWLGKVSERPLVALAPTTRGGDSCAPSKSAAGMLQDITNPTALPALNADAQTNVYFLMRGYDLVVTDYQGAGTKGVQPFANRLSQGHVTLDAARAVRQLSGRQVEKPQHQPVFLWGYSQGGGATAAAAELAHTYASDLKVKGVYAGGVPADLIQVMAALDGSVSTGLISIPLAGMAESYPEFGRWINDQLNDLGKAFIKRGGQACTAGVTVPAAFQSTAFYTKNHKTFVELLYENPRMRKFLEMQDLGHIAPKVPVLVHSSYGDDLLPYSQVLKMVGMWKENGAKNVYFHTTPFPKVLQTFGVSHVVPDVFGMFLADVFFMDQLGEEVPDGALNYVMGNI